LLITIVGLATGGSESATSRIEHSALSQFPVVGAQLGGNIHALHNRAGIGLAVGIIGLIWGSLGAVQTTQFAMAEVWDIPLAERPGFLPRLLRSMGVVAAIGGFLLVSTALAGVVTVGNRGGLDLAGAIVVSVLLNAGIFSLAFRLLTPPEIRWRWLLPGSAVGAAGWTLLQYLGGALVDHTLRHTSQVYGFFAVVLGLLAWIYLGAQLTVYAAEVNVVLHRHLWPRSLREPLTPADREVLSQMVLERRSRSDQRVSVDFDSESDRDPGDAGAPDAAAGPAVDRKSGEGKKPAKTPSGG
jgi:uncharacterized BrkB/YihY/UPF0761 family membrane protein